MTMGMRIVGATAGLLTFGILVGLVVLAGVLDGILRLVHPIMPFVAESIWHALAETAFERGLPAPEPSAESVVIAPWPEFPKSWTDPAMEGSIARMQSVGQARLGLTPQQLILIP